MRVTFGGVLTKREIVNRVNNLVPITYVLRQCGVYVPDGIPEGTSLKTHCPFDFLHSDAGYEAALRVWSDSNSAMCFAEDLYLTPVKLWSLYCDSSMYDAALDLKDTHKLDVVNYHDAKDPETSQLRYLEQALAVFCTRLRPDWNLAPVHYPEAHEVFVMCINSAHKVSTDEETEEWLTRAKAVMEKAIQRCDLHHKQ